MYYTGHVHPTWEQQPNGNVTLLQKARKEGMAELMRAILKLDPEKIYTAEEALTIISQSNPSTGLNEGKFEYWQKNISKKVGRNVSADYNSCSEVWRKTWGENKPTHIMCKRDNKIYFVPESQVESFDDKTKKLRAQIAADANKEKAELMKQIYIACILIGIKKASTENEKLNLTKASFKYAVVKAVIDKVFCSLYVDKLSADKKPTNNFIGESPRGQALQAIVDDQDPALSSEGYGSAKTLSTTIHFDTKANEAEIFMTNLFPKD